MTVRALYAEFTATDAAAAARVAVILADLAVAVRGEAGNVTFDAYRRADRELQFFVYEVYTDEAAFQTHLAQEHGRVFNEELADLVEGGGSALTFLAPL